VQYAHYHRQKGGHTPKNRAINFIDTHKHDDLTPELILELHKIVTDNTIDNPDDEGKFRRDDGHTPKKNAH
jgi:hypothetical protein